MGRYSSEPTNSNTQLPMNNAYVSSNPYSQPPRTSMQQMGGQPAQGMQQNPMANWPTTFPNPTVVLDLHGVLIEYVKDINSPSQMRTIAGALESVRQLRLKGHKVLILADYPGIMRGKQTMQGAEAINQQLMQLLGQAGCFSVDGSLYNTSDQKQDMYAKPNVGMINRAKAEMKLDMTGGYCVGDSIEDMQMAVNAKLTPILVLTGNGEDALKKMSSQLKGKVKVFPDLPSFVNSL